MDATKVIRHACDSCLHQKKRMNEKEKVKRDNNAQAVIMPSCLAATIATSSGILTMQLE